MLAARAAAKRSVSPSLLVKQQQGPLAVRAFASCVSTSWTTSTTAAKTTIARRQFTRGYHHHEEVPVTADYVADKCSRHVIHSPYDPIPHGPYPPLADFILSTWKSDEDSTSSFCTLSPFPDRMDKLCTVDTSTGLQRTFGEQYRTIGGLAASLKYEMNVGDGDCVALYCPNHVDYLAIPLAVSMTGAMLTPVNPLYTEDELSMVLQKSRATIVMVHVSKLDVALKAIQRTTTTTKQRIQQVIVITDDQDEPIPEGTVALNSLRHHDKAFHTTIATVHEQTHEQPCILPYSSGTTGMPKGVCLTHENIVANLYQIDGIEGSVFPFQHKLSSPLPFFHIYAFTISMLYTAWKGQTLITNSGRFDLEEYCKAVEEHRVERAHLVPPILLGLAKSPIVDKYDLSSLQTIISAAAPLSGDIEEQISKRIGCTVKQFWGMSELSPLATGNSDRLAKSGSVGPLTASTYGKVVDSEGTTLGPHQSGELLIKGPQVMKEYLYEPDKTAETMSQSRWLRTGDVAHYDEDGHFYITDRIKELIKVRGFQVAPAELEALLLTHEAIQDVAVIGMPDETAGESPRAVVVLDDAHKDREEEYRDLIYAWVKERVAPYKRLDGGIVFTDKIPKSASGKILRRILRDEMIPPI